MQVRKRVGVERRSLFDDSLWVKALNSVLFFSLVLGASAEAAVLLSTTFDGQTLGAGSSDPVWVANGISDPGAISPTAVTPPPAAALFTTAAGQNAFAVDLNIHNEGHWFVDIPFEVVGLGAATNVLIDRVEFTGLILNNGGGLQGVGREADFLVELRNGGGVVDSVFLDNVFAHNGAFAPNPVSADFNNLFLAQGNYDLRITASANGGNQPGNNAGFDNLTVFGAVVPEPSRAVLGGLAFGWVILLRRRRF